MCSPTWLPLLPLRELVAETQDFSQPARNPLRVTRWLILLCCVVVNLADQGTKALAAHTLDADAPTRPLLGKFLGLRLTSNSGAALSLLHDLTWVITIFSVVVVAVLLFLGLTTTSKAWALTLGCIVGGGLANLYDRFFRPPYWGNGHVVDFIDYGFFVGNVADIAIVLGVICAFFLILKNHSLKPREVRS